MSVDCNCRQSRVPEVIGRACEMLFRQLQLQFQLSSASASTSTSISGKKFSSTRLLLVADMLQAAGFPTQGEWRNSLAGIN